MCDESALYTNNLLRLNDSIDGAYAFTLIYAAPNLTAVCMQSRGRTFLNSAAANREPARSTSVRAVLTRPPEHLLGP